MNVTKTTKKTILMLIALKLSSMINQLSTVDSNDKGYKRPKK